MLSLLAGCFWFIFFTILIYRLIRNRQPTLSLLEISLAFGCKIIAGITYGYIFLNYYQGDDTWLLHFNSIREKQLLIQHPARFFWEFTPATAIRNGSGLLQTAGFYLNDLEYCLQAKILGIVNLVSHDNYYINVVFWNFILFWGHFWLFKLFVNVMPTHRKWFYFLIFFFPPTLFWLSGIRSDGLIFFFFSLCFLRLYRWCQSYKMYDLVLAILGLLGVLIFRPAVSGLLLPAIIGFWISNKSPATSFKSFAIVYSLTTIVFFTTLVIPGGGLPQFVIMRQQEFLRLKGTSLPLDTLQPTLASFMAVTPQAAANTFVRPFPWETAGILQISAAMEILLFWVMICFIIINRRPDWKSALAHPVILFSLLFGCSMYLFIGYTIPFPGAIVRYKTIAELLLLAATFAILKPREPDITNIRNI